MPDPYDHSGLNFVCYRGRAVQLQKILGNLKGKTTPDQVSVVGPRYFGKSVLLKKLYDELAVPGSRFDVVILWDLKANTPTTNVEFLSALAQRLDEGLAKLGLNQYSEYLKPDSGDVGENIREVIQDFGQQGHKALLLLDGFDRMAREPQISRNLWDYLRALAQDEYLSYVIASRRGLREAIPDREGRNSEFWNIFTAIEVIKPLDASDLHEWLKPLIDKGFGFDDSARKELLNWTGGAPLLLSRVCAALDAEPRARIISKLDVDVLCNAISQDQWTHDHLMQMWEDCPEEAKGDLIDLALNPGAGRSFSLPRQKALADRGYLVTDGGGARPSCRFLLNFAATLSIRSRDLRQLVKNEGTTLQTMRTLLQLRLDSVPRKDACYDLRTDIEHAVDGLGRGPRTAMIAFRSIADEAVALAWSAEFPGNQVPVAVQQHLTKRWEEGGGGLEPEVFQKLDDKSTRRRILNVVAGNQARRKASPRIAQKVSRPMMVLIDHLADVGNFGQHIKDVPPEQEMPVDIGFCIAACWSATELLRRAVSDLA